MSEGKYLSLEEARKQGKLDKFAKQQNKRGSMSLFDRLLDRMARKPAKADQTSGKE